MRLGGTEKGSESAACHGVSGSVDGELDMAEQGGTGSTNSPGGGRQLLDARDLYGVLT